MSEAKPERRAYNTVSFNAPDDVAAMLERAHKRGYVKTKLILQALTPFLVGMGFAKEPKKIYPRQG
jgi:hypothetical protein